MYALHYKLYTIKIHLNIRVPSYQYNRVLTDFHSFSLWHQSCMTSAPQFLHSFEGIPYRRLSGYLAWNILFWPHSIMSANNWIHFKMWRFAGHQHKKIIKESWLGLGVGDISHILHVWKVFTCTMVKMALP